ncbi:unnamed protein product [Mesocestoides corti]|uniref:Uncharacterized protein n=1 Tax=Mesocestoides corti TaxID=53468 RepID=A0A0R3U480_MESCO|nr:unnamed protein product [Mesocestoides corti]
MQVDYKRPFQQSPAKRMHFKKVAPQALAQGERDEISIDLSHGLNLPLEVTFMQVTSHPLNFRINCKRSLFCVWSWQLRSNNWLHPTHVKSWRKMPLCSDADAAKVEVKKHVVVCPRGCLVQAGPVVCESTSTHHRDGAWPSIGECGQVDGGQHQMWAAPGRAAVVDGGTESKHRRGGPFEQYRPDRQTTCGVVSENSESRQDKSSLTCCCSVCIELTHGDDDDDDYDYPA